MFVIDTNSLLTFVRYYLPFDRDGFLLQFIEKKIASHEIVIIDKVFNQCSITAKGIVVKNLPFLIDNKESTAEIFPDETIFRHLAQEFINPITKRRLNSDEIEVQTTQFLEDADLKMMLYCRKNQGLFTEYTIVTEETDTPNDNKLFKKIPTMCKFIDIKTIALPELLTRFEGFNWQFKNLAP